MYLDPNTYLTLHNARAAELRRDARAGRFPRRAWLRGVFRRVDRAVPARAPATSPVCE